MCRLGAALRVVVSQQFGEFALAAVHVESMRAQFVSIDKRLTTLLANMVLIRVEVGMHLAQVLNQKLI